MPKTRSDSSLSSGYDWDKRIKPPNDEDVEEYRNIEFELNYPTAELRPWSELKEHEKAYWRKRYKHGE